MVGRMQASGWVGALVLAVTGAGPGAAASEPGAGETGEAYRMTLQILGGMASCGDEWSGPEYYGAATRQDREVEEELDGVRGELEKLEPRIEAFDERIEPLLPREHNTVPLSDDEQQELAALRERGLELERELKEKAQQLSYEERRTLEGERSEVKRLRASAGGRHTADRSGGPFPAGSERTTGAARRAQETPETAGGCVD